MSFFGVWVGVCGRLKSIFADESVITLEGATWLSVGIEGTYSW